MNSETTHVFLIFRNRGGEIGLEGVYSSMEYAIWAHDADRFQWNEVKTYNACDQAWETSSRSWRVEKHLINRES